LNGQIGLFVARISRLAEEANGWQAFFSVFFEFFFGPARTLTAHDSDHLRPGLFDLNYASIENEVFKIPTFAAVGRFDGGGCRRLAFHPLPRQANRYWPSTNHFIPDS
jgi:hypothetical protein